VISTHQFASLHAVVSTFLIPLTFTLSFGARFAAQTKAQKAGL
jgi:hypothetical protein